MSWPLNKSVELPLHEYRLLEKLSNDLADAFKLLGADRQASECSQR